MGTGVYAYYCEWIRARNLARAFHAGAVQEPLVANLIEREKIAREITSILQPPPEYNKYDIIVGDHGVGKTTIVKHVSHKLSGVVYVDIEANAASDKDFGKSFAKALNWTPKTLGWVRILLEKLGITEPEEHSKFPFFFFFLFSF